MSEAGSPGRGAVVALVDANDVSVIVWWTHIGPREGSPMSRLCGAWVLDRSAVGDIESVTFDRVLFATKTGNQALIESGVINLKVLDLGATLEAAVAFRDKCQRAFEEEQATRIESKKLIPPEWPSFPSLIDVENPPKWELASQVKVPIETALATARWLEALCARWERLEEERLARPWLAKLDGNVERALPVVVMQ
jgi:hypothetical protein